MELKDKPIAVKLDDLITVLSNFSSVGSKKPLYYLSSANFNAGSVIFNVFVFGYRAVLVHPKDEKKFLSLLKDRKIPGIDLRAVDEIKKHVKALNQIIKNANQKKVA